MEGPLRRIGAVVDASLRIGAAALALAACRAEPATVETPGPAPALAPAVDGPPSEPDAPAISDAPSPTETAASEAPLTPTSVDIAAPTEAASVDATPTAACCRTCRKGKACGNTCIAADRRCEHPPGCACDATD
ncbi:MAG: hypothetical protein KC486_28755 [Myxococcales bacterium]|nr:hypothetical protein [Myxococcales bacterium]